MKKILLVVLTISQLTSCAQSDNFAGEYEAKSGLVQYRLILNPNGTFYFHSYNKYNMGLPSDPSISGRGTWRTEKHIIFFTTDPVKDLDYKYRLNFNNSKARIENESPGNKANKTIVTRLKFLESDIFWISGIELIKRA